MTREILTKGLELAKREHLDLVLLNIESDAQHIASMNTLDELMDFLYELDEASQYVYEYEMC